MKTVLKENNNFGATFHAPGYENYHALIPIIRETDKLFTLKMEIADHVMQTLSQQILNDNDDCGWLDVGNQPKGKFARSVIGRDMADPHGPQIIVAHWGKGFTSPVHGHIHGYMNEVMLKGQIKVNNYRMLDPSSNVVRVVSTNVESEPSKTFVNRYNFKKKFMKERSQFIHNYVALETSHSLHHIPEEARDGKDNLFMPEYFEETHYFQYELQHYVKRIHTMDTMSLPIGSVLLIRSDNVAGLGDHFIIITGPPVLKPHGLRPQTVAFDAPLASAILNKHEKESGAIVLLLEDALAKEFHEFHAIHYTLGGLSLPLPTSMPLS